MNYHVIGQSDCEGVANIKAKSNTYTFGIKSDQVELAGPAELLLSAFASCCLKNVERFAEILKFTYVSAEIEVSGIRQEKPPMFTEIQYSLRVYGDDEGLNTDLLQMNLEKFGTIYNTLSAVCTIQGELTRQSVR